MALLDWTSINPYVRIQDTKKKLYNRFFYSVKYHCPGGRLILQTTDADTILAGIEHRNQLARTYNYGGSWRYSTRDQNDKIDIPQLLAFQSVKQDHNDNLRLRIEEPAITVYSESEDLIFDVAKHRLFKWANQLEVVVKPADDMARAVLESGSIIIKKPNSYTHKIILRDGKFPNKNMLGTYLANLGDHVKVSKTVTRMLAGKGAFIWGVWFYTSDPSLVTTLSLIEPGIVLNIHPLVQANK
jgi:hypothetical protein